MVDVVGCLIVNSNVATESHPTELVPVHVFAPLVVYKVPFHEYESQFEIIVVDVVGCLIVKFNVATESHPAAFVPVHVLAPLVV